MTPEAAEFVDRLYAVIAGPDDEPDQIVRALMRRMADGIRPALCVTAVGLWPNQAGARTAPLSGASVAYLPLEDYVAVFERALMTTAALARKGLHDWRARVALGEFGEEDAASTAVLQQVSRRAMAVLHHELSTIGQSARQTRH